MGNCSCKLNYVLSASSECTPHPSRCSSHYGFPGGPNRAAVIDPLPAFSRQPENLAERMRKAHASARTKNRPGLVQGISGPPVVALGNCTLQVTASHCCVRVCLAVTGDCAVTPVPPVCVIRGVASYALSDLCDACVTYDQTLSAVI